MRIRKRALQPLFPLPPASPPSTPDLQLQATASTEGNGRKEARQEGGGLHPNGDLSIQPHGCRDPTQNHLTGQDPDPFDPKPTMGSRSHHESHPNGSCMPSSNPTHVKVLQGEEVDSSKIWNTQVNSNKCYGSCSGAAPPTGVAIGRWCEEERVLFPLKKRRGSYDIGGENKGEGKEEKPVKKEKKAKGKARVIKVTTTTTTTTLCTNKKCDDVVVVKEEGGERIVDGNGKKRRSPAVLMEGSRCSRVNGRGWRCCQQTLVGYSLCEHHLGKGRLRSMSSVRGQIGSNKPTKKSEELVHTGEEEEAKPKKHIQNHYLEVVDTGEEEEKPTKKKKRKKIGMVKARSISSLLDQTNHSTATMSPATTTGC